LFSKVIAQIQFEIGQIDKLFETYAELLQTVAQRTPTLVELTALGSVIHSFYNGVENIFGRIAKAIDQSEPSGPTSHRDLLTQMGKATVNRPTVVSNRTAEQLEAYRMFRHFYRHSYSYFLSWDELESLVTSLPHVWEDLKQDLYQLVAALQSPSDPK
jgi:hypothetical protein